MPRYEPSMDTPEPEPYESTHQKRFGNWGGCIAIGLAVVCILVAIVAYFYFKYSTGMFQWVSFLH